MQVEEFSIFFSPLQLHPSRQLNHGDQKNVKLRNKTSGNYMIRSVHKTSLWLMTIFKHAVP